MSAADVIDAAFMFFYGMVVMSMVFSAREELCD